MEILPRQVEVCRCHKGTNILVLLEKAITYIAVLEDYRMHFMAIV